MSAPIMIVDGDSLAHRAYHALPKSIKWNAVVGFTNMIVRLWESEQPRAVLVGLQRAVREMVALLDR